MSALAAFEHDLESARARMLEAPYVGVEWTDVATSGELAAHERAASIARTVERALQASEVRS